MTTAMQFAGALTHVTVPEIVARLRAAELTPVIDLSAVERADSAAVALLLEIRRRVGEPLQLENTPQPLLHLIDAFGIAPLLTGPSSTCTSDH